MRQRHDDEAAFGPSPIVILCHPDPASFNAMIAQSYCVAVCARHRADDRIALEELLRVTHFADATRETLLHGAPEPHIAVA